MNLAFDVGIEEKEGKYRATAVESIDGKTGHGWATDWMDTQEEAIALVNGLIESCVAFGPEGGVELRNVQSD